MIVDTHLHPLSPDETAYPRLPTSRFQGVNTADDILKQMQHAGVDRVVGVQFFGVYGNDNSYVADCVTAHPEAFAGVGCVDPLAPDAAEALAAWVKRGIRGLRLFTPRDRPDLARWPDEPAVYPLYEAAIALGTPVCLSMQPAALEQLGTLLQRFPAMTVVLDHLANVSPGLEEAKRLMALAPHANLQLKFSTQNFPNVDERSVIAPVFMSQLVQAFGDVRLMWGSNYPVNKGSKAEPYRALIDQARVLLRSVAPSEQDAILGGTAARVFKLM